MSRREREPPCVEFTCSTSEVGSVRWSQDGRLAVASRDAVYVLTTASIWTNPQCCPRLPLVVSMATLPEATASQPQSPLLSFRPGPGGTVVSDLMDPLLSGGTSCDSFRESDWSPVGCSHMGGCLLAGVSSLGRLLVFRPPGTASAHWALAADLCDLCSESLVSMETSSEILEPLSKRRKLSGRVSSHTHRSHMTCCVTCKWLPSVLPVETSNEERVAVIAMATRSGHIALLSLQVPLQRKRNPVCSVLLQQQLPVVDGWACSLHWRHTGVGATTLYVGCTSGQVFSLVWSGGLVLGSPKELLSSASPEMVRLWGRPDGEAVRHMLWTEEEEEGQCWLLAGKGSRVVALDYSDEPSLELRTVASHGMPVSGLCVIAGGKLLSSALDGSLLKTTLPTDASCDSHVTSEPIAVETANRTRPTIQGIAVSEHSMLAAVHTSAATGGSKSKCSSLVHFLTLPSSEELDEVLKRKELFHWDVCQYLLTQRSEGAPLSLPPTPETSAQLRNKLALSRLLLLSNKEGEGEEGVREWREELLRRHVTQSLETLQVWQHLSYDPQSALCASLMSQWLLHDDAADVSSETCALCGNTSIVLSSPLSETCSSCQHTWQRCSVTLCLSSSALVGACLHCGAHAHNLSSLPAKPGSWLHHLLTTNSSCVFCGGYFGQIL